MGRPIINTVGAQFSNKQENCESEDSTNIDQYQQYDRCVYLVGEINEQSAMLVIAKIIFLSQINNTPINLVLNTPGGFLHEAFAIYDAIKLVQAPVHTIGIGKVMSAGVMLLAAGEKGQRLIGARASIMIHNIRGHAVGDIWNIKNDLQETQRLDDLEAKCLLSDTKITKRQYEQIAKKRLDNYITPEEAIKFGIADDIFAN